MSHVRGPGVVEMDFLEEERSKLSTITGLREADWKPYKVRKAIM